MHERTKNAAWFALFAVFLVTAAGCAKAPPGPSIRVRPVVHLVKPETRTLTRSVGQPGFVYAYEQTSIYPKVAGYIKKWNVDIGDTIKKDQVIAEISVPELVAEHRQKQAQVKQSEIQVRVADELVNVAQNNAVVATAQVQEARSGLAKYQASVDRWQSEVKRLEGLAAEKVIDRQVLEESRKQLKSDSASRDSAKATVAANMANELARKADLEKARVDVEAARAKAAVDQADEQRLAALVGYTHILAPYDGVVVLRNANTGDYVQPGSGDFSAMRGSPEQSTARGAPIYIVARTDRVRVYVDVPESEAAYVNPETPAKISLRERSGEEIDAKVTRTSWSLLPRSRTLRAEIDLPNPGAALRPGSYAYGRVVIERRGVMALPLHCVVELGNENVCYRYENGKAIETPVQTGLNDGRWIEVTQKKVNGTWIPFTGSETVIQGNLAELSDGQEVEVLDSTSRP